MQGAQSVTQRCCLVTRGGCTPSGGARSTLRCRSAAAAFQMILHEDQKIFTVKIFPHKEPVFTEITFNTRTADPRTTQTLSQQPAAPWAYPRTLCSGLHSFDLACDLARRRLCSRPHPLWCSGGARSLLHGVISGRRSICISSHAVQWLLPQQLQVSCRQQPCRPLQYNRPQLSHLEWCSCRMVPLQLVLMLPARHSTCVSRSRPCKL